MSGEDDPDSHLQRNKSCPEFSSYSISEMAKYIVGNVEHDNDLHTFISFGGICATLLALQDSEGSFRSESCSLFCVPESLEEKFFSYSSNARLITQAYLVIFDNGGGNLERDFSSARAFEMLSA